MTDHIFIFRVRPDGHVEEPDAWRICSDAGDVVIHREPGESNNALRARTMLKAGPDPKIIKHSSEVPNDG